MYMYMYLYSPSSPLSLSLGVDKSSYTDTLVPDLLDNFLFPASHLVSQSRDPEAKGILNIEPK